MHTIKPLNKNSQVPTIYAVTIRDQEDRVRRRVDLTDTIAVVDFDPSPAAAGLIATGVHLSNCRLITTARVLGIASLSLALSAERVLCLRRESTALSTGASTVAD